MCPSCGQRLTPSERVPGATTMRKRPGLGDVDGAPYRQSDLIAGRYSVKDTAGAGPLGFVFRCHDKELDVEVAVKLIQPRFVQSEDERKALSRILKAARKFTQPNLARVYDEAQDDAGWPFYTLPYLDGLTLRKIIDQRVSKGQFFTVREVEPILSQLVAALEAVHTQSPHGNVKPSNVIIQPDLLKLTDYGLGLALPHAPFAAAQRAVGNDRYLAPEYLSGQDIDVRADQYALGIIVGEMLAGAVPVDGELPELRTKNPELQFAVEAFYRRALNENPAARFKSLREMLGAFIALAPTQGPPPIRSVFTQELPEAGLAPPVPDQHPALDPRLPGAGDEENTPSLKGPRDTRREVPQAVTRDVSQDVPHAHEPPPPDATIPISAEELAARLGEPLPPAKAAATTASGASRGDAPARGAELRFPRMGTPPPKPITSPPIRPPLLPRGGRDAIPTTPELPKSSGGEFPTMAFETLLHDPPRPAGEQGLFSASRKPPVMSPSALLLTVLSISGIALGALVGTWWLDRLHKPGDGADGGGARAPSAATAAAVTPPSRLDLDAPNAKPPAEPPLRPPVTTPLAPPPPTSPRKETMLAVARSVASAGATCPEDMRFIPAGAFRMGTAKDDAMRGFDERVLGDVDVGGYCVDQFEFPNKRGQVPLVTVSWTDAKRRCEAQSKRLCSEQEWEKACKGPQSERFPYGNEFDPAACNTDDGSGKERGLKASGRFAKCRSGFGVADLSGNAAEWVSTPYATGADKTQKGGSFGRPDYAARCSARKNGAPSSVSPEVGLRCCANSSR